MNVAPWPSYIKTWSNEFVLDGPVLFTFPDEPEAWWMSDGHVLLRGAGRCRPKDTREAPKNFLETASLDVARRTVWNRTVSVWEHCHDLGHERLRHNGFYGISAYYARVASFWPQPALWSVPRDKKHWNKAAWLIDVGTNQIVMVIMPMKNAATWEKS